MVAQMAAKAEASPVSACCERTGAESSTDFVVVDKLIFKRLYAPAAFDAQSGRMLRGMILMTLEQLVGKYVRLWGSSQLRNRMQPISHVSPCLPPQSSVCLLPGS
jgi:hypothetical protein